jgi:hypothetical protein
MKTTKPPPLLIGVALLFWGWQSDLLLMGALLGVMVESALVFKTRWDFSDDDFTKTWTLCSIILLAAILFAFTNNEGPSRFANMFDEPTVTTGRSASVASSRTAAAVLRWLPMIFFPFLLAQTFSTRESIPLTTISLILQRRWRRAKKLGAPAPEARGFNVGYPYFCMTLLSASFHAADDNTYFWGFCALATWALWMHRSRRYSVATWLGILAIAGTAGYFGQRTIANAQAYLTRLNTEWLASFVRRSDDPFQSRTSMGAVGRLKQSTTIVVRLEPDKPKNPPSYLRESSYRLYNYKAQTWFAGTSRDDFQTAPEEQPVPSGNWNLLADKRATSRARIAVYLDGYGKGSSAGLLPLPSGVSRLEKLLAFTLDYNSAGSVLAHGPGLVIFDALYGPGATIDSPAGQGMLSNTRGRRVFEDTGMGYFARRPDADLTGERMMFVVTNSNQDIAVPTAELPAIEAFIGEFKLRGLPPGELLNRLQNIFQSDFKYSMWQSAPTSTRTNRTPLARFLNETRSGHCEFFATASALVLRHLGIPTRYATGYVVHEESGSGYVVRMSDAHAWILVWDKDKKQWFDFEPTPPIWVEVERGKMSPLRWLKDAWNRIVFEFSRIRNGQSNLRQYLLWIIIPGTTLLLYQIIFRGGRKRTKDRKSDADFLASWPGLDSDFYRLEKKITELGVTRKDSEPLSAWLERVIKTPGMEKIHEPLRELIRLHYRHRFDPEGLNNADRERLKNETQRCLKLLAT